MKYYFTTIVEINCGYEHPSHSILKVEDYENVGAVLEERAANFRGDSEWDEQGKYFDFGDGLIVNHWTYREITKVEYNMLTRLLYYT